MFGSSGAFRIWTLGTLDYGTKAADFICKGAWIEIHCIDCVNAGRFFGSVSDGNAAGCRRIRLYKSGTTARGIRAYIGVIAYPCITAGIGYIGGMAAAVDALGFCKNGCGKLLPTAFAHRISAEVF